MNEHALKDILRYFFMPIFALMYWRGTWNLCNLFLFPSSLFLSGISSLLIGYVGLIISMFFQVYFKDILQKQGEFKEKTRGYPIIDGIIYRIHLYLVGFYVVNCWRGLWLLQDVLLLPQYPQLSGWISHIIGTLLLFLFYHFQTVYAPPVLLLMDNSDVPVSDGYKTLIKFCSNSWMTKYSHSLPQETIELNV